MRIVKSKSTSYYNPNYPYAVYVWFNNEDSVINSLSSIRKWCIETYGEEFNNPPASSTFQFKTEEQLMWFNLRWS